MRKKYIRGKPMTTNYERIKNMTLEEMAKFLKNNCTKILVFKTSSKYINEDMIYQWLQSESEQ